MTRLCPKCGADMSVSQRVCRVCGTIVGSGKPWGRPFAMPGRPAGPWGAPFGLHPSQQAVGVPRRFGVGTLMILTTVFAVLFGTLKTAGVPPEVFVAVSLFVGGVAVCQVLLFQGKDPRKASFFGGMISAGVVAAVMAAMAGFQTHSMAVAIGVAFGGGVLAPLIGGPLGYAAGALVAAVFLVRKEPGDDEPTPEELAEQAPATTTADETMRPLWKTGVDATDSLRPSDVSDVSPETAESINRPAELPVIGATLAEPPFHPQPFHESPPVLLPAPLGEPVGVPRRFSIGTMMILVTAFAVLFGVLKMAGASPAVFSAISLFIGGVAASQALLFKGEVPRLASFVGGIVMFLLIGGTWLVVRHCTTTFPDRGIVNLVGSLIGVGIASMFCGGPLGYVVGCFVAAIFLVRKEPHDEPMFEESAEKNP
jgi:hypothetical protein